MDHSIDMGPDTWVDWVADYGDNGRAPADPSVQLAALRNYIEQEARRALINGGSNLTAAWLDKKAPRVGITARFETEAAYALEVPVSGVYRATIHAANRGEAMRQFLENMERATALRIEKSATHWTTATPTFVSGPEDTDPVLPDDAPTTVDATLVALRETILLAVIAGPKVCVPGANEMLANFGLGTVPERKRFRVSRPVEGVASTTVEAFDEASAQRVAEWRWENQNGWTVSEDDLKSAGSLAAAEA